MDRLKLMGAVSAFGVLLGLPVSCTGESFTAAEGGSSNGSGGSTAGSAGKNGGQGGSMGQGGSKGQGGSGLEPGTGGVVSTGGDPGAGGDPGVSGSVGVGGSGMTDGGDACGFGSITFKLKPGPNATNGAFCTESCISWVTVYSHVADKWLMLSNDCAVNDCATCMIPPCVDIACTPPQAIPSEGVEKHWDGTNYGTNYCDSELGIEVACLEPVCLPLGAYEARMCAYVNNGGTPDMCAVSANQVCVDVNFDFDGSDIVVAGELE